MKNKKIPKTNKITSRFDNKKTKIKRNSSKILQEFLLKAGLDITPNELNKRILITDAIIIGILSIALIIYAIITGANTINFLLMFTTLWIVIYGLLYLVSLLITFSYLDLKIYQRTKQIEEVLPDFLQLTSANISAGITIDRALWLAVRPRFGVLAKEMEEIAKSTTAGEDLEKALQNFSRKYDSRVLKESINLLIAGLQAGGELGLLLDKIASNIQDIKLMRKEISASVTAYIIFIAAASVGAAPLLYALSFQLLGVVQNIAGQMGTNAAASTGSSFSFELSANSIKTEDFKLFSMVLLGITAIFSAAITSIIKTGNIKGGFKNIPIYLAIAIIVYITCGQILGALFSGFF